MNEILSAKKVVSYARYVDHFGARGPGMIDREIMQLQTNCIQSLSWRGLRFKQTS